MTEIVLKFLYDNRQSLKYNKINHLLVDKKPIDVRYFIRELVENKFVSMNNFKYNDLGNGTPTTGLDTVELKARITPKGVQYYSDTYMKKNDSQTFNIDQLVNIGGDNNAPISQTTDHSSSSVEIKKMNPSKQPPKTLTQTLVSNKNMKAIVITVVGGLILFAIIELIKYYFFN